MRIQIVERERRSPASSDLSDYSYLPSHDAPESLVSYLPLTLRGAPPMALQLTVSLDEERVLASKT